jgi:hypothetical protein
MSMVEIAQNIREALRKLFGSRLTEVMQIEILRLQAENQQLRQDKDAVIADLRAEKSLLNAKVTLYETNINQRVGIDPTRKRVEKPSFASFSSPPMMTSWQREVQLHEEQLEEERLKEEAAAAVAK